MSREFEPIIQGWLADEAPREAPDWILRSVLEETSRLPHRRPLLRLPLSQPARTLVIGSLAVAVAAVAFAAGIGFAEWSRIGGPRPTPAVPTRPADIPTDGTCEVDRQCLGVLAPGTYGSAFFAPPVTFRVEEPGWENLRSSGGVVNLLPLDSPGDEILLLQGAVARTADNRLVTGIGRTPEEYLRWLAEREDLAISEPQPATVGGLDGVWTDVVVRTDAPNGIRGCPANPCVVIAFGADPSEMPTWAWDLSVWRGSAARVYVLDHDGATILLVVRAWDESTLDQLIGRAQPIIDSLGFGQSTP